MTSPKKYGWTRFGTVALPICISVISMGSFGMLQKHVDSLREADLNNEMLYFPNAEYLHHFTAGLENVVADFMWYKTVQYTAREFKTREFKFTWLEHMVRIVTTLDQHYVDPYRYGGLFLSMIDAEELAIPILKHGIVQNPNSWEIPYELHTIYLMNRGDDPSSKLLASRYAMMVAERHEEKYKQFYVELAQRLLSGNDMHDEAIAVLRMALEDADDPFLRTQTEKQLLNAYIEKNVYILRTAAETFRTKTGQPLKALNDLVQVGLISGLPDTSIEGEYFIDASGTIQNMTLVEDDEFRTRSKIERHLARFIEETNRKPVNLDELATYIKGRGYPHPLPGKKWAYDPATDAVTVQ